MKQWRLRSAANKLSHFDTRNGGGSSCSASVPLNGGGNGAAPLSPSLECKAHGAKLASHHQQQFECEISPCGSRRLQGSDGSRGSRGSDSAFVAPGSDGYSRDLKPSEFPSFSLLDFYLTNNDSRRFVFKSYHSKCPHVILLR